MTDYAALIADLDRARWGDGAPTSWVAKNNAVVDAVAADIEEAADAAIEITHSTHDATLIQYAAKVLVGLIEGQHLAVPEGLRDGITPPGT